MASMGSVGRIGFAAALGLALACSGRTLGGGGSGGTGGMPTGEGPGNGGQGAGGQAGAGGTPTLALPGCLQELLAPCVPAGACVTQAEPMSSQTCFASGVRVSQGYMVEPQACAPGASYVHVKKPDGSFCYRLESYVDASIDCHLTRFTWKDGAGNVVATGTYDTRTHNWTMRIACAATDESVQCVESTATAPPVGCCNLSAFGAPLCAGGDRPETCAAGTCP